MAHLLASDREVVGSDPDSASWIAEVREHRTTFAASRVPVHSDKFTGNNLRSNASSKNGLAIAGLVESFCSCYDCVGKCDRCFYC